MVDLVERPAKDRFSSLDARALALDLRALDHPRVDKAFDAGPNGWALSLKLRSGGRKDLLIVAGSYGAVTTPPAERAETPGPFARELRRLLGGAVLGDVADPGGDRVLDVEFQRAEGGVTIRCLAEFFGSGNVIVVRDETIVAVAHPRTWAHRTLRVGRPFVPAPATANPWTTSSAQLEVLLLGSSTDRVTTLAARAGFSGAVAEELLARAGAAPHEPARSDAGPIAVAVRSAADQLLEEIGSPPSAYVYHRGGAIIDVTPYPSVRRRTASDVVEERRDSFGDALAAFYAQAPATPVATPRRSSVREGLERQRARQAEAVERLNAEAEGTTARANRLLERYPEAEAARKEAERSGAAGTEVAIRVGDLEIPIDPSRPLEISARALYEEAKRVKSKLSGAREALADTESRLRASAPEPEASAAPVAAAEKARRPLWFESFRWFVSSEGILVIAGRDATSNDLVVRRYLRDGDRYIHADLHGAASVVVKVSASPGASPLSEATLREAGQFAVAFSKAWRANHASADAFWVLPDQVSKAAASGEFVAKGAWVIHGTKHVMRDLPLELALGTIEREGRTLWSVAPPAALPAPGAIRAYLSPDEERGRAEREKELVRDLGIPRDVLQRLLPAGGLRIRRA